MYESQSRLIQNTIRTREQTHMRLHKRQLVFVTFTGRGKSDGEREVAQDASRKKKKKHESNCRESKNKNTCTSHHILRLCDPHTHTPLFMIVTRRVKNCCQQSERKGCEMLHALQHTFMHSLSFSFAKHWKHFLWKNDRHVPVI